VHIMLVFVSVAA